jgi:hypothetical protein
MGYGDVEPGLWPKLSMNCISKDVEKTYEIFCPSLVKHQCLHLVIKFRLLQKLYVEKWYAYENPHGHAF